MTYAAIIILILSIIFFTLSLYFSNRKKPIVSIPLGTIATNFKINMNGKYTIWIKRKSVISFINRGIYQHYNYIITDKQSGKQINLEEYEPRINEGSIKTQLIENRWLALHTFNASPGSYQMTIMTSEIKLGKFSPLKKLGIFNPFSEINPEKFTFEIVPFQKISTRILLGALVVTSFFAMIGSLILMMKQLYPDN